MSRKMNLKTPLKKIAIQNDDVEYDVVHDASVVHAHAYDCDDGYDFCGVFVEESCPQEEKEQHLQKQTVIQGQRCQIQWHQYYHLVYKKEHERFLQAQKVQAF